MEEDKQSPPPKPSGLSAFWAELKRRKVMRVAITYIIASIAIIEFASVTFEGFGIPVWAFRFVMLMVIMGFPLAIILAWAFELTPDGVRRDTGSDAVPAVPIAEDETTTTAVPDGKSIAVLPFENLSRDSGNEPFTIGVHDDLITQISKIGAIKTISRTSVMQYRETTKTIPQIATELGVATVLEGGIQGRVIVCMSMFS